MQLGKRTRSTLAWIICLMVLVGSFASAMRLKLGVDAARSSWIEVCTVNGMKLVNAVQSEGSTAPADDQSHHQSGHCPWCSASAAAMGMPPSTWVPWQAPTEAKTLPILFLQAPTPLFAWASAQPRAPPQSA